MVNNSTNIIMTKYYISLQITEHTMNKKKRPIGVNPVIKTKNGIGNPVPGIGVGTDTEMWWVKLVNGMQQPTPS
jgi:hypothetical protein